MKWPRVIGTAILIAWCFLASASPRSAEDKPSNRVQKQTHNNQGVPPSLVSPVVNSNTTDKDHHPSTNKARNHVNHRVSFTTPVNVNSVKDRWDEALVVFTALIVAVGIFQIVFLWKTVQATSDNAKAANNSVTALMHSERPWLLIELNETNDRIQDPYIKPAGTVPYMEQRLSHCIFYLKNYGKTPARLMGIRAEVTVADNPNEPPGGAIVELGKRYNPYVFPPSHSLAQVAELPGGIISAQDAQDINKGLRFLWLRGIIKYQDTVGAGQTTDHETVFCYVWEIRMNTKPYWRLAGSGRCNSAT